MKTKSLFVTDYGLVRLRDGTLIEAADTMAQQLAYEQWKRWRDSLETEIVSLEKRKGRA